MLNNEEMNTSGGGNNSNSNKQGLHIKTEDSTIDPLSGVDSNLNPNSFGQINTAQQQGLNRPAMMSQNSPERIQPLPSNIVNKQSNSMDVS